MHEHDMYDEMVIYVEACESGSMFPTLADDLGVFAMTASNAKQSSFSAYCGTKAYVDGHNIRTCLGDLFSVNWMEDLEAHNPGVETFKEHFDQVFDKTTMSKVHIFGDHDILSEPVGDFFGVNDGSHDGEHHWGEAMLRRLGMHADLEVEHHQSLQPEVGMYDSRDVKLHYLFDTYLHTRSPKDLLKLQQELEHRQKADLFFKTMALDFHVNGVYDKTDYECLRFLIGKYETICGKFTEYSLQYSNIFADICEDADAETLRAATQWIRGVCTK